jgi:hypothetical protein
MGLQSCIQNDSSARSHDSGFKDEVEAAVTLEEDLRGGSDTRNFEQADVFEHKKVGYRSSYFLEAKKPADLRKYLGSITESQMKLSSETMNDAFGKSGAQSVYKAATSDPNVAVTPMRIEVFSETTCDLRQWSLPSQFNLIKGKAEKVHDCSVKAFKDGLPIPFRGNVEAKEIGSLQTRAKGILMANGLPVPSWFDTDIPKSSAAKVTGARPDDGLAASSPREARELRAIKDGSAQEDVEQGCMDESGSVDGDRMLKDLGSSFDEALDPSIEPGKATTAARGSSAATADLTVDVTVDGAVLEELLIKGATAEDELKYNEFVQFYAQHFSSILIGGGVITPAKIYDFKRFKDKKSLADDIRVRAVRLWEGIEAGQKVTAATLATEASTHLSRSSPFKVLKKLKIKFEDRYLLKVLATSVAMLLLCVASVVRQASRPNGRHRCNIRAG